MNYKLLLKILLIGFIIFAVVVTLGIKYNWVKYIQPASETIVEPSSLPNQAETNDSASSETSETPKQKIENIELVDEGTISGSAEEMIRNDCIRASRRAGVTDENIFSVVDECVEMSKKTEVVEVLPVDTPTDNKEAIDSTIDPTGGEASNGVPTIENSLELTRKACKIVADEEHDLSIVEREKVIEQCVKANMDDQ